MECKKMKNIIEQITNLQSEIEDQQRRLEELKAEKNLQDLLADNVPDCFKGLKAECDAFLSRRGFDLSKVTYSYTPRETYESAYKFSLDGGRSGRGEYGHWVLASLYYYPVGHSWSAPHADYESYHCFRLESVMNAFWSQLERDVKIYLEEQK